LRKRPPLGSGAPLIRLDGVSGSIAGRLFIRSRTAAMRLERSQKFGQSAMTKITDLRLERRWRRLRKPDGNCAHCERSADRLHPVGPIIVKVSSPDTDAAGESWIYEFCSWKCLGHWAAIEAGFVPPNYGADRARAKHEDDA